MKRRNGTACAAALALFTGLADPLEAQDCSCLAEWRTGERIVRVAPGIVAGLPESRDAQLEKLSEELGRPVREVLDRELGLYLVVDDSYSSEEAIRELEVDSRIEYSEPNWIFRGATNDPAWPDQWGLKNTHLQALCPNADSVTDIRVESAWQSGAHGQDVLVAVIDSGLAAGPEAQRSGPTHADLARRIWRNERELNGQQGRDDDGLGLADDYWGWDFVSGDNLPRDENGHGTKVAAILAAEADNGEAIAGVAPSATLLTLRFLDRDNKGSLADAVRIIDFAGRAGARVVNMSWTGCKHAASLADEIRKWPGIVFVAAAGNREKPLSTCPEYPAALSLRPEFPHVLSVMGVGCDRERVGTSNYGADVAAPGKNIRTFDHSEQLVPDGGTSMAAPFVSGTAALILSSDPELSAIEVANRIRCTADAAVTQQLDVLYGVVDADKAVHSDC